MENKKSSIVLIRRIIPYFVKYKWVFLLDLFCATMTTLCELVFPVLLRYLTNIVSFDIAALTLKTIATIGAIYFFLAIIDIIGNYYMTSIGHIMGAKIETSMRRDLFNHMQKLHLSYYDNNKIGQMMSRLTNDLFDITEFTHHCPEEFLIAGIKIIVSFLVLINFNIYLTFIIYAVLPIILIFSIHYNKKMQVVLKKNRVQFGELNAQAEDSFLGIRVIKSFSVEDNLEKKFCDKNIETLNIKKIFYKFMGRFRAVGISFDRLMYLIIIALGSLFLLYGKIAPGDLVAYVLYVSTLLNSITRIMEFTEQFQKGITGIDRFMEIMDIPIMIKDSKDSVMLDKVKGKVEFKDVKFKYVGSSDGILNGINMVIEPHESVALVGPSGAGKTTICNLIERFYDVNDGQLLIDGVDIKKIRLKCLHKIVGSVHQDVYLFSGSIYENICYGNLKASYEQVIDAAKKAGIHDVIESLPDKYNTYVGERGVKLSGGQKQRISIARVFLKDPPILILDEATSSLDSESEKIIQESLKKLSKGRTTITIAHRLTSIKRADKIYVLCKGEIEEKGTHEQLMKNGSLYSSLYNSYIN